jgi:diguanylate cyclase (GGDEF)-like protein
VAPCGRDPPPSSLRSKVRYRGGFIGSLGWRGGLRTLSRRPFVLVFAALAVFEVLRLIADPNPFGLAVLALVVLLGVAAVREHEDAAVVEGARLTEAESFARILRGLSRSVSPDAIVDAIVEELGAGTGADHVGVVRRRPETRNLEAILSPTRVGAPASRTFLPLSELEDPAIDDAVAGAAIAGARGRRLAAVPIEPDLDGGPDLASLGLSAGRAPGDDGAGRGRGSRGAVAMDARPAAVATPRRGPGSQAVPARPGADQRIADRIAARLRDDYGLHNVLAAPLRVDGRVEGAIVVSRRTREPWSARARGVLGGAALEASAALARVYSLRDAEVRATTDALTGLPNRRYFDEYLLLLSRRRRADDRVGVLMIDIDRFKKLNDTFGHAVGDHVLREVAQAIAGAVREGDVPARFGGEEFAVVLRNPGDGVAVEVGERVRRAVAGLDLRRIGVPGVSVSVGVAEASPPDVDLADAIERADRALFRAKRAGRDRVVAA